VQSPLPIWMGVGHPDALAPDGDAGRWLVGSGGSSIAEFGRSVPLLPSRWKAGAIRRRSRSPSAFHGGG